MSGLNSWSSKRRFRSARSVSGSEPGRPGIMWAVTFSPASLATWNALTESSVLCPLLLASRISSWRLWTPISILVMPYSSIRSMSLGLHQSGFDSRVRPTHRLAELSLAT